MLTRLQVKGFKNLVNFDIRFGPFTCLAGPNGVGKSNIFDAIHFLHLLSEHSIRDAVQMLREAGDKAANPDALFSFHEQDDRKTMSFVADMIVEPTNCDAFGQEVTAKTTVLRYELEFVRSDGHLPRLELSAERLLPIKMSDARSELRRWAGKGLQEACMGSGRTKPFISSVGKPGTTTINVHQDQRHGRLLKLPARDSQRTVLNHVSSAEYPTILAAQSEMRSWRRLALEPSAMRAPSSYHGPTTIDARGGNIPSHIWRLKQAEPREGMVCAELANALSELIDDVRELRVTDDAVSQCYILEARGSHGPFLPARSLSDGTLRFLALAVVNEDPEVRGMICLEEPENGMHPSRIPEMLSLLQDIAVDTDSVVDGDNPLRQVLINTHSPKVVEAISPQRDLVMVSEGSVRRGNQAVRGAKGYVLKGNWRLLLDSDPPVSECPPGDLYDYLPPGSQVWHDLDDKAAGA